MVYLLKKEGRGREEHYALRLLGGIVMSVKRNGQALARGAPAALSLTAHLPQSSSASRRTAGAPGFFILAQEPLHQSTGDWSIPLGSRPGVRLPLCRAKSLATLSALGALGGTRTRTP
jgi:hypothetical protein